jgi:aminopeptidase N
MSISTDVTPLHYRIHVIPRMDGGAWHFRSEVEVEVHVLPASPGPVTALTLHAHRLNILSASVHGHHADGGGAPVPCTVQLVPDAQLVIVQPAEPLSPGHHYYLHFVCDAPVRSDLAGFYLSTYTDSEGRAGVTLSTQFEPTGARSVFPCWYVRQGSLCHAPFPAAHPAAHPFFFFFVCFFISLNCPRATATIASGVCFPTRPAGTSLP